MVNEADPHLTAPAGTYRSLEIALADAWGRVRGEGRPDSLVRDKTHLRLELNIGSERRPSGIHVGLYQPMAQAFCGTVISFDIAPDDQIQRLSARLDMAAKRRDFPQPETPSLDSVLAAINFVLQDHNILIG